MSSDGYHLRTFKTKNFKVICDCIPENNPDFSFDKTGETERNIRRGVWTCFVARVRVFYRGHEIGADYLGNCIYESFEDFMDHRACGKQNRQYEAEGKPGRCGSYFHDMIREAIAQARNTVTEFQTIHVRS